MNRELTVQDVINLDPINDRTRIYLDITVITERGTHNIYKPGGSWFEDQILDNLHLEVQDYVYNVKQNGLLIRAIKDTRKGEKNE